RNDGSFRFTDVTQEAGVGDTGMGLGVACADFDNNGYPDIYINNYGPNRLYLNNGDGTFSEVSQQAGVSNGNLVGSGVAFFDMEGDGDLDLYVANYIQFDPENHRIHIHKGLPSYPSPMSFDPEPDTLFANNGDGTFSDVSETSGIRSVAGRSMGLIACDFDNDGDCDVVVANDTQENYFFQNDGMGNFEEIGLLAGLAYDYRGKPQASMGVALLDFNRDGRQDLYFTSFSEEFATCYENLGDGLFDDVTLGLGASQASFPHVTWGVVAEDLDNDGESDVYIGAGDLDVNRDRRGGMSSTTAFQIPDIVLSSRQGKLVDMGSNWGDGARVKQSTRGVVCNDLDSDGRMDIVTLNARSTPTVLRNEGRVGNWLSIQLVGVQGNRDGIGSWVSVRQGDQTWHRPVICGHSYQSDSSPILHFGLPSADLPLEVEVRWDSERSQRLQELRPNQHLTIVDES
ncbi:MAG: CRTAC1 family protein, partial [bacterium]|nr:CRTAC1 family protein [bacterium]